jgi:hypothetical protein
LTNHVPFSTFHPQDNRKARIDTMLEKDSPRFDLTPFFASLSEVLSAASDSFCQLLPKSGLMPALLNAVERGSDLIKRRLALPAENVRAVNAGCQAWCQCLLAIVDNRVREIDDLVDRVEFNRTLQKLVSCGDADACRGALRVIGSVIQHSPGPEGGEVELMHILELIRVHSVAPQTVVSGDPSGAASTSAVNAVDPASLMEPLRCCAIFRSLLQCVTTNQNLVETWRDLGGFETVITSLASLDGVFRGSPPPPPAAPANGDGGSTDGADGSNAAGVLGGVTFTREPWAEQFVSFQEWVATAVAAWGLDVPDLLSGHAGAPYFGRIHGNGGESPKDLRSVRFFCGVPYFVLLRELLRALTSIIMVVSKMASSDDTTTGSQATFGSQPLLLEYSTVSCCIMNSLVLETMFAKPTVELLFDLVFADDGQPSFALDPDVCAAAGVGVVPSSSSKPGGHISPLCLGNPEGLSILFTLLPNMGTALAVDVLHAVYNLFLSGARPDTDVSVEKILNVGGLRWITSSMPFRELMHLHVDGDNENDDAVAPPETLALRTSLFQSLEVLLAHRATPATLPSVLQLLCGEICSLEMMLDPDHVPAGTKAHVAARLGDPAKNWAGLDILTRAMAAGQTVAYAVLGSGAEKQKHLAPAPDGSSSGRHGRSGGGRRSSVSTLNSGGHIEVSNFSGRAWPPSNGFSFSCWFKIGSVEAGPPLPPRGAEQVPTVGMVQLLLLQSQDGQYWFRLTLVQGASGGAWDLVLESSQASVLPSFLPAFLLQLPSFLPSSTSFLLRLPSFFNFSPSFFNFLPSSTSFLPSSTSFLPLGFSAFLPSLPSSNIPSFLPLVFLPSFF